MGYPMGGLPHMPPYGPSPTSLGNYPQPYGPPGGYPGPSGAMMPPIHYPPPGFGEAGKRPAPDGLEPEPPAKRQKTDGPNLIPEQEFLEQNPVRIFVRLSGGVQLFLKLLRL